MKTTRRPFYFLGTIINGTTYAYTALGTFKTAASAADRCQERRAIVFEQCELWKHGVNYGHSEARPVAMTVGA